MEYVCLQCFWKSRRIGTVRFVNFTVDRIRKPRGTAIHVLKSSYNVIPAINTQHFIAVCRLFVIGIKFYTDRRKRRYFYNTRRTH
ncbi:Uncharacterised protein [Bacteroides xylanisolvens]|nr:Uncharacterised protein [Bacteroides xylanisolvens]